MNKLKKNCVKHGSITSLYIYITETFEAPTIFHVSTVLKKNVNEKKKKSKENPFLNPDKNLSIQKHKRKKKLCRSSLFSFSLPSLSPKPNTEN